MKTAPPSRRRSSSLVSFAIGAPVLLLALAAGAYFGRKVGVPRMLADEELPRKDVERNPRRRDLWVERVPSPFTVPKASAEEEKNRYERNLTFHRKTLAEAYDRIGKKHPRWDGPATQALEKVAQWVSGERGPGQYSMESIHVPAKQAVELGCDDPLILFFVNRSSEAYRWREHGAEPTANQEPARRAAAAAVALDRSAYPAIHKVAAYQIWLQHLTVGNHAPGGDGARGKKAREVLDRILALVPQQAEEVAELPEARSYSFNTLEFLMANHRIYSGDDFRSVAWLEAGIKDMPGGPAAAVKMRGRCHLHSALMARGPEGLALSPRDRKHLVEERAGKAREAFEQAWDLEPNDAVVATNMLPVTMNLGGDRATMKLWFDRAMAAAPGHSEPCNHVLDYFDPRWYGTEEEMLAFARECADSGQWASNTPTLLVEAHSRLMEYLPAHERDRYFRNDEVWTDIKSVFEDRIANRRSDRYGESQFAFFCHLCGHDDLAAQHFRRSSDVFPPRHFEASRIQQVRQQILRQKQE
jgi:hypothetical protein